MLEIGIPKEVKAKEKRVGLTPEGVSFLTQRGIQVWVQSGAGIDSGFHDKDYVAEGARTAPTLADLYAKARIIQKVKEPQPIEFGLLRPEHILFSFLHLASPENGPVLQALIKSGAAALGYETLEIAGKRPLLTPMSEIAGALSAAYASYIASQPFSSGHVEYSEGFDASLQRLALTYPGIPLGLKSFPTVIWGGGVAGEKALEFSLAAGSSVSLVEKNPARRTGLLSRWKAKGQISVFAPEALSKGLLEEAVIFIGCVHQTGARALRVLDEETLKAVSRAKRKVIMDVAIDQGGNFPEARATTYDEPLYLDSWGNIRFSVANIPSLCGPEASRALTEASKDYSAALAGGLKAAFEKYPELEGALNVRSGRLFLPLHK